MGPEETILKAECKVGTFFYHYIAGSWISLKFSATATAFSVSARIYGTQGMSRVYFQPHIEKCSCILWLECLPMSEYLSHSSPTSYQTGSLMRYVVVWLLSHVWLFATPWTIVRQAPPSMEFSRQEYRSGWITISFSRGSSRPRNWTHISCIGRRIFYHSAIWEALVRLRRDLKGCLLKMTFYFMWLMTPSSEMIKLLWFIWLVGVWPRIMLPGQHCFLLHMVH